MSKIQKGSAFSISEELAKMLNEKIKYQQIGLVNYEVF